MNRFLLAFISTSLPGVLSVCLAQPVPEPIVVNIRSSGPGERPVDSGLLNGYLRTLDGNVIPYHSSHPDAKEALIVRTQKNFTRIAWETDTVRDTPPDGVCRFVWLAGIDRGGFGLDRSVKEFVLSVNDEKWFTFTNARDSSAFKWEKRNANGAALEFRSALNDLHNDLFGTMLLTVPSRLCRAGAPLRLSVTAGDSGKPDWFMTMRYTYRFVPKLRCEPVVARSEGNTTQLVRFGMDNLSTGDSVTIQSFGGRSFTKPLAQGFNSFLVPVAVVKETTLVPVSIRLNDREVSATSVEVAPVARRDVLLIPYSHTDIGYTMLQPDVEKKQWNNLDLALGIIDGTKAYPPGARFKWNLEVLWPLEGYLARATPSQKQRVFDAIRNGSIGLNAFYANILTGLATDVELSHAFDFAKIIRKETGVPLETALISDIPGFTWGTVGALARAGVKYFAMAPNAYDRVGYAYEKWGDKPFFWQSQSGAEEVLAWLAGASYSSFHEGTLGALGDDKMFAVLRSIEARRSPYAIVQMPYTVGGDNGPPDSTLSDFVRSWNERYESPRLSLSTYAEAFRDLERSYKDSILHATGDFTPYWEDGAASTAWETALNRHTVDRLVQAATVFSMKDPRTFPSTPDRDAWRNVILYDEHTWGAWNSVSQPDSPFVKNQWAIKRQFALDADSISRALMTAALAPGKRPAEALHAVDVINTSSEVCTDVVVVPAEQSTAGDVVRDASGRKVMAQRLTTGALAFNAKNVPAFGVQRYSIGRAMSKPRGQAHAVGHVLTNGLIRATIDTVSGAISSLRVRWGRMWLEYAGPGGLNEYQYLRGRDPKNVQRLSNVRVIPREKGGLVASLVIRGDAPGCTSFESEIFLYNEQRRIDIVNRIDKKKEREKESVHFGFDFAVAGAQPRYDVAGSIVRAELDQLPGACKNFFTAQSWVDVSNDSMGVTCALPDAPMFEVGGITAEQAWMKTIAPSPTILSYAMNNYWHTNYKADQEGPVEFRYSLLPHRSFKENDAVKFGMERRERLLVAPASGPVPRPLAVPEGKGIVVTSVKPVGGGETLLLSCYNPRSVPSAVAMRDAKKYSLYLSSPAGKKKGSASKQITVRGFGTVYVLVEKAVR